MSDLTGEVMWRLRGSVVEYMSWLVDSFEVETGRKAEGVIVTPEVFLEYVAAVSAEMRFVTLVMGEHNLSFRGLPVVRGSQCLAT